VEQLRVPTITREARIHYRQDLVLNGRVFLPQLAERHEGRMRADEWMNRAGHFFPFLPDGDKETRLLNKAFVMVMTIHPEEGEEEVVGTARRVVIECGTLRIAGTAFVDMPEHESRTLDWANAPDAFLALHNEEGLHVIQKNCITLISDLPED
jgi:hypothetical protein